ncbi:MAG TPA: prepilin peptidase [Candidatus Paceibacterota bacterium]|nr:prepilin peptidase [Candidatus Paceibacterota bacterium]
METTLAIAFFALGAVVASFMGVLAGRLNTGQGFLAGRSRCDACGRELAPSALVPVFSYVLSGGRARCCGARISIVAPLSEACLGALYALAYASFGLSYALFAVLLSLALLFALVLYDFMHQVLPPALLAAFAASAVLSRALLAPDLAGFLVPLMWGAAFALLFLAIQLVSRGRAMGLSDAPLVFALAALAGDCAFAGFLFSFWIGAIIGITLLFARPPGSRMGVEVPFAPFLAAGFLLALFTQWNPLSLF